LSAPADLFRKGRLIPGPLLVRNNPRWCDGPGIS